MTRIWFSIKRGKYFVIIQFQIIILLSYEIPEMCKILHFMANFYEY